MCVRKRRAGQAGEGSRPLGVSWFPCPFHFTAVRTHLLSSAPTSTAICFNRLFIRSVCGPLGGCAGARGTLCLNRAQTGGWSELLPVVRTLSQGGGTCACSHGKRKRRAGARARACSSKPGVRPRQKMCQLGLRLPAVFGRMHDVFFFAQGWRNAGKRGSAQPVVRDGGGARCRRRVLGSVGRRHAGRPEDEGKQARNGMRLRERHAGGRRWGGRDTAPGGGCSGSGAWCRLWVLAIRTEGSGRG